MVTPFDDKGKIDFAALGRLIEHVIAGGADYLVALGTTAETPTLSCAEKDDIVAFVRETNADRLPLVVGVGGNNTADIVSKVERLDTQGIEAILSVTPYYNKPNKRGLYEHYKAVAGASPLPVILYNVPGRTGVNMTAETTLKLAHEVKNVAAVKEACGNLSQIAYILRDRPEGFMVLSGDDNMCLPLMAMGGEGVISVAANVFPSQVARMAHLMQEGKTAEAARLHLQLLEPVDSLFAEGNPVGIKAALHICGMTGNNLRLPLVPASDELTRRMKTLFAQYGLI